MTLFFTGLWPHRWLFMGRSTASWALGYTRVVRSILFSCLFGIRCEDQNAKSDLLQPNEIIYYFESKSHKNLLTENVRPCDNAFSMIQISLITIHPIIYPRMGP